MSDWKKEAARDVIALGGVPFYFIVVVRVLIGESLSPFYTLTYQFLLAALLIFLLSKAIKNSNNYVSRSLALLFFTSLNYNDNFYTIFVSILWILLLGSLVYIKTKKSDIVAGFVVGLLSTGIAHIIVKFIIPATGLPL